MRPGPPGHHGPRPPHPSALEERVALLERPRLRGLEEGDQLALLRSRRRRVTLAAVAVAASEEARRERREGGGGLRRGGVQGEKVAAELLLAAAAARGLRGLGGGGGLERGDDLSRGHDRGGRRAAAAERAAVGAVSPAERVCCLLLGGGDALDEQRDPVLLFPPAPSFATAAKAAVEQQRDRAPAELPLQRVLARERRCPARPAPQQHLEGVPGAAQARVERGRGGEQRSGSSSGRSTGRGGGGGGGLGAARHRLGQPRSVDGLRGPLPHEPCQRPVAARGQQQREEGHGVGLPREE